MAAPDGALQAQLASWFASIDPTMQQVLKDIYAEAPAAVSKAISGGAWVAEEGDPPLEEVVGGANPGGGLILTTYDVTPWPATVGTTVTVKMGLMSSAGQPGFRTEVKIVDPTGNERNETLNGDAMAAGGETTQEFTIENALEGAYAIDIDVNPDGAPQGEIPNDNGTRLTMPNMGFEVMTAEGGAGAQEDRAFSFGASQLSVLTSAPDWNTAHSMMPDALNYLASIENLEGSESGVLSALGDRVPQADSNIIAVGVPNIAELLTDIGAAASQASTQEHVTPEVRKPLFDALTALNEALGQALAGAEA